MTVNLTIKDVLTSSIMLAAALLILLQTDEFGHMLALEFHGLLYATILLLVMPVHHIMLVCHGLMQTLADLLD